MAQSRLVETKIRLVYDIGMDEEGYPIYKGKIYSNIQTSATMAQLRSTALMLASLSSDELETLERNDKHEIHG